MSGLLSWKLNQGDPRAGFAAAGTRWSALVGIGDNTVAGLLDGRKINPMIPSARFVVYVLITGWRDHPRE